MKHRRLTAVLGLVALLLAAVVALEAVYVWGSSTPAPTSARPVVVGDVAARSVVQTAAHDSALVFGSTYRDFDGHVELATQLMTPYFAARYRAGAEPVKKKVVRQRSRTVVRVVGSGVVWATPDAVQALLFLDQATTRRHQPTSYSPRRALVTMVRTSRGWLVGDVQTR